MKLLRHGWWKRWVKILLRIDPLVGMYIVSGGMIGVVLDRIEGNPESKYLVHWFCETPRGERLPTEHCVAEALLARNGYCASFFYSRKEAERYRNWRETTLAAKRAPSAEVPAMRDSFGPN